MLTTRGWWLLLIILAMLATGMLVPPPYGFWELESANVRLIFLALTVGLWFAWEWLLFTLRARLTIRRLRVERIVRDIHGPVENLWMGRSFRVQVQLKLPGGMKLPYLLAVDRIPFGVERLTGNNRWEGELEAGQTVKWRYRIRPSAPGRVRFEGIALQMADLHGFFYRETFLPVVASHRVMPPLTDAKGQAAKAKRHNLLPPPGVHRFRRPGSGSELLDLRDYRPGDPPKTIAWKLSARRDRLITKDFESEVPVRCTLFVDTSHSVRLGPPGENTLSRLTEIAATVAQANTGTRDMTGLCMFNETGASHIRPARGPRHMVKLINLLTDAAGLAPATAKADADALLPLAYSFAQEVYPDLMRADVNRFPWWLPWFSPQPAYTRSRPKLADYLYAWQPFFWLSLAGGLLFSFLLAFLFSSALGLLLFLLLLLVGLALLIFLDSFFRGHRRVRWRKRLAALLAVRYGLGPGGLALLLEDDEHFALCMQHFLADHQVPYALPFYDEQGRYLFAAPEKVEVLAKALLRAVGKGRDNELFVLLADLLELTDGLGPLLRAVKVALARHHQVMVICPWPVGIPPPARSAKRRNGERGKRGGGESAKFSDIGHLTSDFRLLTSAFAPTGLRLQEVTTARFHRAFRQIQRTFARLKVPVVCAQDRDPVRLILARLERLRGLGIRR
jgi:uncharacterized protein (DUF58 family)